MARLLASWPLALETEAGRVCVTTDRAVAAGQLLLDAPSYAVAISADWLERVCVGCAKVGYAPFRLRCEVRKSARAAAALQRRSRLNRMRVARRAAARISAPPRAATAPGASATRPCAAGRRR
jgi:hypothetical protein